MTSRKFPHSFVVKITPTKTKEYRDPAKTLYDLKVKVFASKGLGLVLVLVLLSPSWFGLDYNSILLSSEISFLLFSQVFPAA